jgi:hypothetical protein
MCEPTGCTTSQDVFHEREFLMTERTTTTSSGATKTARATAKAPPAWLITASMFVGAVVTIVLVLTGQ